MIKRRKLDTTFTPKKIATVIAMVENNLRNGQPKKLSLGQIFGIGVLVKIDITPRKDGKPGYRHEISLHSKTGPLFLIGQGAYASVSLASGVIVSEGDGSLKKFPTQQGLDTPFREYGYTNKGREKYKVIKRCDLNKTPQALIDNEVENTAPELRMRKSVNQLIMNRAPGIGLDKLLKNKQFKSLNLADKVNLVLAVFVALRDQVYLRKLAHHDIKPENIIVDITLEPFEIKQIIIVDYGLSMKMGVPLTLRGSAEYIAPELFHDKVCQYQDYQVQGLDNSGVDVFAMAVIATKILGFKLYDDTSLPQRATLNTVIQHAAKQVALYAEHMKTVQMDDADLKTLLLGALNHQPQERSKIDDIINTLTEIINKTPLEKGAEISELSATVSL